MSKPRILVTMSNVADTCLVPYVGDSSIVYSDHAGALAIIKAGGLPLYLPAVSLLQSSDLEAYLSLADGVFITGADSNVDPRYYGKPKVYSTGRIDSERDQVDIDLIRLAYGRNVPLLGVCKGMQLINVALGGTLYQDVDKERPGPVLHSLLGKRTEITHQATLVRGSMLSNIFGRHKIGVNGGHTQAIKELSYKLLSVAIAEDGVVEAVENKGDSFLLAMQFHAELLSDKSPYADIFKAFVGACSHSDSNENNSEFGGLKND